MDLGRHFFPALACCLLLTVKHVSPSAGPVFIPPGAAAVAAPSSKIAPTASQGNYLTQTVYGFLDFTTTIGNTVMVFSPQSAAAVPNEPVKDVSLNSVIDTKPSSESTTKKEIAIKPSKTQASPVEKKISSSDGTKKVSSIVQVKSNPPAIISSKVEIKAAPSTRVNVIEGIQSVVNVASSATPPVPSPKVDIVNNKVALPKKSNIITKVDVVKTEPSKQTVINPPAAAIFSSKVEIVTTGGSSAITPPIVEIRADEEPAAIVGNNIGEPEYDFLSRQPSEVVEETYKVINLKPSSKFHLKPRPSAEAKNKAATKRADSLHPTGLVTKLGGTVVKDGATTIHETSVIGTYISGKYAQVLQSTSHIVHNSNNHHQKGAAGKINPSPSLRILKTAAPSLGKANKLHRHLEPTPAASINEETALPVEALFNAQNAIKQTRKPTGSGVSAFKPRFKNRQKEQEVSVENKEQDAPPAPHPNYKKAQRARTQTQNTRTSKQNTSHRPQKFGRSSRKTTTSTPPVSVHSEEATTASTTSKRYQLRRNKQQQRANTGSTATTSSSNSDNTGYSRRGYKPKVQPSAVDHNSASTSLYKFKLNRSPGRWQYKTTPKPRVTIRKQNDDEQGDNDTQGTTPTSPQDVSSNDVVTPQSRSDDVDGLEGSESIASIIDDESATDNKLDTPFPLETLKVEISTPPDFKDIYYEIATIKSPYTFQVGNVKNTRYITVTSTFEKSFANTPEATISPTGTEPLTENILATSSNYAKDNNFLDSSIATLPPIYLASDMETPPLETLTETFSTTQTMLKTHILPVVRSGNDTTASSTLVQTYLITRLVTATKTLPPMEAYHFIPSKTLNEFNSHLDEAGSELHLELEFGDHNDQDDGSIRKAFPADLDLANIGSEFNLSDVDKSRIPDGQHLRSKKAPAINAHHNKFMGINDLTLQTPGLNQDQLQQLALLRLLNPGAQGQQQVITTSRPVIKIETVYESHVLPVVNGANTVLSTISKILGTVTKTDYEFGTSTIGAVLPVPPPVNPLFQQPQQPQQQQFAVTTSPIVQSTLVTQTSSKVLKLTFGAKTAYTTVYKTTVVPTLLTTYITGSVAVQPTAAAFPGFFPGPYPGYPFVG